MGSIGILLDLNGEIKISSIFSFVSSPIQL